MNWAYLFATIAFFSVCGTIFLAFEFLHTRQTYESVYKLLLADRDAARKESETLRAALFPQLAKLGAEQAPKRAQPAAAQVSPPQSAAFNRRIPFRLRFKQLVKEHNTTQMGRDRMAAAITTKETGNG